jgi:hypothetical protein
MENISLAQVAFLGARIASAGPPPGLSASDVDELEPLLRPPLGLNSGLQRDANKSS